MFVFRRVSPRRYETLVRLKLLRRGKQGPGGLFLTANGAQIFNDWPDLKDPPTRFSLETQLEFLYK
jgi:hypothetical protein